MTPHHNNTIGAIGTRPSNLTIGFGNGVFHKHYTDALERFSVNYMTRFLVGGSANALELQCPAEPLLDHLIMSMDLDFSPFRYLSLHAPNCKYTNSEGSNRILSKIAILCSKYGLKNVVFHLDAIDDWGIFQSYQHLPLSIENADDKKPSGATIHDIISSLERHPFINFTLDLQHCFMNDGSMRLALDLQKQCRTRIVEYHVSGAGRQGDHVPLFRTVQHTIIDALQELNAPIIIESSMDQLDELSREYNYVTKRLRDLNAPDH